MSFMGHLEALRWHLMRSVIVWLVAAIIIFIFIDFFVRGLRGIFAVTIALEKISATSVETTRVGGIRRHLQKELAT